MQNTVCSSLDKVTDIQAGRHAEGFNHKQLNYSMYVASYVSQYSRVNAIVWNWICYSEDVPLLPPKISGPEAMLCLVSTEIRTKANAAVPDSGGCCSESIVFMIN